MSGAWAQDWLIVGWCGGEGGAAVFWLIDSSAWTSCWTGSMTLVSDCAEAGGECCRGV